MTVPVHLIRPDKEILGTVESREVLELGDGVVCRVGDLEIAIQEREILAMVVDEDSALLIIKLN